MCIGIYIYKIEMQTCENWGKCLLRVWEEVKKKILYNDFFILKMDFYRFSKGNWGFFFILEMGWWYKPFRGSKTMC